MFAHRWCLINERLENKPFLFISERVILYFRTAKWLTHKIQVLLALNAKGIKVTFTNITRLKNKLLEVEGR